MPILLEPNPHAQTIEQGTSCAGKTLANPSGRFGMSVYENDVKTFS
jgi:hypothetical protein